MTTYIIFALAMGLITFALTFDLKTALHKPTKEELEEAKSKCRYRQKTELKSNKKCYILSIFVAILIYAFCLLSMPTLGLKHEDFWILLGIVVITVSFTLNLDNDTIAQTILKVSPICICFIVIITCMLCFNTCNRTEDYKKLLQVERSTDSEINISPMSLENIPIVDINEAKLLASPLLEQIPSLGSRAFVGSFTRTVINGEINITDAKGFNQTLNFNNNVCWVAPIEHGGFWKWKSFTTTPGYILVDAVKAKAYFVTKVNNEDMNLKYLESSCFSNNLKRHIRKAGYVNIGLTDWSFEVDDSGYPYHVITLYDKAIGWSVKKVTGVLTVNPITGEIKEYTVKDAPKWIDRIYPEELIEEYIAYAGDLVKGYWNWADEGKFKTTSSSALVDINGESYFYDGLQSISTKDAGTNGFMLTNTRTGKSQKYSSTGITEDKAIDLAMSIEWVAQASAKYGASSMILPYNIKGELSYLVIIKDAKTSSRVGFAFISLSKMTIGEGKTLQEAYTSYSRELMKTEANNLSKSSELKPMEVTVKEIAREGNCYYFLFAETGDIEFYAYSDQLPKIKWVDEGDKISITANIGENETQIPIIGLE